MAANTLAGLDALKAGRDQARRELRNFTIWAVLIALGVAGIGFATGVALARWRPAPPPTAVYIVPGPAPNAMPVYIVPGPTALAQGGR